MISILLYSNKMVLQKLHDTTNKNIEVLRKKVDAPSKNLWIPKILIYIELSRGNCSSRESSGQITLGGVHTYCKSQVAKVKLRFPLEKLFFLLKSLLNSHHFLFFIQSSSHTKLSSKWFVSGDIPKKTTTSQLNILQYVSFDCSCAKCFTRNGRNWMSYTKLLLN